MIKETEDSTVQVIRNITFTNLYEFSKFYQKLRISYTKFTYELAYEFVKKLAHEISEIGARILNKERNLYTRFNKPTRLRQDGHSKTSSFDNYMVSLKNKSIKITSKFSTYNFVC